MTLANTFIRKLFKAASNAEAKGGKSLPLKLTPKQFPAFFALRELEDAASFRAEIDVAQDEGAIEVLLMPRASRPMDVEAIRVADLRKLARYLNEPLLADQLEHASLTLSPYAVDLPVLDEVLSEWQSGRKVRGYGPTPEAVSALADAARVVLVRQGATKDLMLRRFSRKLFKSSKRIEGIGPWIDLVYSAELSPSGLHVEEVRGALGLHHEPQAFFIHADAEYWTSGSPAALQPPYVGLPTNDIRGFRFFKQPNALLLIENKQSFHEFAAQAMQQSCAVVYTAGMPSPSWRAAMQLLLAAIDPDVPVYHLGDIDLGGFRIAANISRLLRSTGRVLRPWLMNPTELAALGYELEVNEGGQDLAGMQRWCREAGWEELALELAITPGSVEQELVEAKFPV